ncbi:MAG TPA: nucleotide exchange factor GrpE [Bacillota bacterium]|nr:nucleotide exchange factor GrpE [Bacillota bacterium]
MTKQQSVPQDPIDPVMPQGDEPQMETDLNSLIQQIDDLTAGLQRERADAVNLRRRYDEQLANLRVTVRASVLRDLLPVIDNFERALKHTPEDLKDHDFVKGVQGVVKQFEKVLADLGVEKIKTVGEPFDPNLHEAVSMEEGGDGQEIVSEELQSGYRMGDEVLRHAMVRVRG